MNSELDFNKAVAAAYNNNNVLYQNSFNVLYTLYIRGKRPLFSYSFGFNCFRYLDRTKCHARLGHTEEGQI